MRQIVATITPVINKNIRLVFFIIPELMNKNSAAGRAIRYIMTGTVYRFTGASAEKSPQLHMIKRLAILINSP
jgi:hypothetical protein